QPGSRLKIQEELKSFHPLLIINRVVPGSKLNTLKLKKLASKYLGIYLPELGEIPEDEKVPQSVQAYMPISEYASNSNASAALLEITAKLDKVIELFGS
ncbi:MAG: ATP-binding protein, partial [Desulfocapsaceae bacterium]|nr:ATP-binding protein [Desulfocapsaceae bacterium]